MRELRTYGSGGGRVGNHRLYPAPDPREPGWCGAYVTPYRSLGQVKRGVRLLSEIAQNMLHSMSWKHTLCKQVHYRGQP